MAAPAPAPATTPPAIPLPGPKPDPTLAQHGFLGAIGDFNAQLQQATDQHVTQFGYRPDPATALTAVTQAGPQGQVDVQPPPSVVAVKAAVKQAVTADPHSFFVTRPDGRIEQNNPVKDWMDGAAQAGITQVAHSPAEYQAMQKKYPWVATGALPVSVGSGALWGAIDFQQKHGQDQGVSATTFDGLTADEYARKATLGSSALPNEGLAQRNTANTIRQAQQDLKDQAPEFFASLPVNGVFNQDWSTAAVKYQTSAKYFRQQTEYLSQQNHFGNDTQGFVRAWKSRDAYVAEHPDQAQIVQSIPLALWSGSGDAVKNYFLNNAHGWQYANVPGMALGAIVNSAKLALGTVGGTFNEGVAQASAINEYLKTIAPHWIGGKGESQAEAEAASLAVLKKSPNLIRAIAPDVPDNVADSTLGQIANLAGQVILGDRLVIGGPSVKAGDMASALGNRYLNGTSRLAFNALAKNGTDGLADATRALGGGEKLAVATADAIRNGELSYAAFRQHVAELLTKGTTTVGGSAIQSDPLLTRLSASSSLPKPITGSGPAMKQAISHAATQLEDGLRRSGYVGTDNVATLFSSVRQLFSRVAPEGEVRSIFNNQRLPEDIYNYAVKQFGDRAQASAWQNRFIQARATDNVQAVSDLNDEISAAYREKYPNEPDRPNPIASSGPQIESESLANFRFPGSNTRDATGPLDKMWLRAQAVNDKLNTLGQKHRAIIISGAPLPGGESLFYKHAVADTMRRFAGGGGVSFTLSRAEKATKALVDQHALDNPAVSRMIGADRASAELGENKWLQRHETTDKVTFQTGDHLDDPARMVAAGGFLRRQITDDALKAYRLSSKSDLSPLVNLVKNSGFYRAMLSKDKGFQDAMAVAKEHEGSGQTQLFGRSPTNQVIQDYAEKHAEQLYNSYRAIEGAGQSAGVTDPLTAAQNVLVKNQGASADKALGEWIRSNGVNFNVTDGLVQTGSKFDNVMQAWIGGLLTFNKLNRKTMYDKAFYGAVKDFTDAGWDMNDAVHVASELAKQQTVYHMLDFSNMLQVEQNLRWLSYFATKHRLYWTWVGKYAVTHPASAAAVNTVSQHLDSKGNLPVTLFGHRMLIPAARLVWANASEYPETSPPVEFFAGAARNVTHGTAAMMNGGMAAVGSTSGNIITRNDQALLYWAKLAAVMAGHPATSSFAGAGLTPSAQNALNRQINEYATLYHAQHGFYPSEQEAVKHILYGAGVKEAWRSNMFVPVLPNDGPSTMTQKLLTAYGKITDAAQKRDFLDKYPQVADTFGVTTDPAQWLHERSLWDKFNGYRNAFDAHAHDLYLQALRGGFTVELKKQLTVATAKYQQQLEALKVEDASTWKGNTAYPAGMVSDGQVVTPGPWTTKLEGDPFAARGFLHDMFPAIPGSELDAKSIGQTVEALRQEVATIKTLGWKKAGFPDEQSSKTRLSQIYTQISAFSGLPKTPIQRVNAAYYDTRVGPYIQERDAKAAALKTVPSNEKDVAYSAFRAWKDEHDHPVTVTVDGRTFTAPSPVRMGWALLPADQYKKALAQASSSRWQDLAAYEKELLGIPTPPSVSKGWAAFDQAKQEYGRQYPGSSLAATQLLAAARAIDKGVPGVTDPHPGFYKDYLRSLDPKIRRYESTVVYQNMPGQARQQFDSLIGNLAKQVTVELANKDSAYPKNWLKDNWRNYVDALRGVSTVKRLQAQSFFGALDKPEYAALKKELTNYDPNFLYSLVVP